MKKATFYGIIVCVFVLCACRDKSESSKKAEEVIVKKETIQKELTIYGVQDSATVRQAIALFEERNPNYQIEFTCDQEQTLLKSVRDELSAGKGPDILLLDGMEQIFENQEGIFLELGSRMEWGDILQNKIVSTKDGIYILNCRFQCPVVFLDRRLGDYENENYTAYAIRYINETGKYLLSGPEDSYQDLLNIYYYYCGRNIKKEGEIDVAALKELLERVKQMGDGIENINRIVDTDGIEKTAPYENSNKWKELASSDISLIAGYVKDFDQMEKLVAAAEHRMAHAFIVDNSYLPCCKVSVNQESTNQDAAISFLELLISYEGQKEMTGEGFPVHKQALDKWIETYTLEKKKISIKDTEGAELLIQHASKNGISEVIEHLKETTEKYDRDEYLFGIILTEAVPYFKDEYPIEKIIDNIIEKGTR